MRKLKVLQILGEPVGGIRKHVHEIIFHGEKNNVASYYIHGKKLDARGREDLEIFEKRGVFTADIDIQKSLSFLDLYNIIYIKKFCVDNGINVIHGHGAKGGAYGRVVGFLARIPSIYTPHGGSMHSNFGLLKNIVFRLLELILSRLTSFFLFESFYSYKKYIQLCGGLQKDFFLINKNGVSPDQFTPKGFWLDGTKDKVKILVVGMLRFLKGQDVAIEAMRILRDAGFLKFHLDLCGSGPDEVAFAELVEKYNLTDMVTFHGDVGAVNSFYSEANIIVIPSRFESFGYVAVEACLMGRPVVASNCGGLSEIISDGESGYLFPPGDAISLADKILEVLENKELTTKIVEIASINASKKFNSNNMLDNIYLVYNKFRGV